MTSASTPAQESRLEIHVAKVVPHREFRATSPWLDLLPVLSVFALAAAAIWYFYRQILAINSGTFLFAQDDPYIHLALARNLAHGFYGTTLFEHSSPSSSVFWPFLLAGIFKLTGVNQMVALWIQLPLCLGILIAVQWVLRDAGIRNRLVQGGVLFAVAALTAFLPMAFIALEHLLHCLAMVLFCWTFAKVFNNETPQPMDAWKIGLCAALLTGSRYEGLFTLAGAGVLSLRARRWDLAGAITVGGALPVLGFGLYSLHLGGHLLPNSLLIKGQSLTWRLDERLLAMMYGAPAAFVLALTLAGVFFAERKFGPLLAPRTRTLATLVLGTLVIHAYFASWGWYTRYEAYLICSGVLALALVLRDLLAYASPMRMWKPAVVCLTLPFIYFAAQRAYGSTQLIPAASHDIYSQQYQFARLFRDYYGGQVVAVNDVGAVDFFSGTNAQDIVGLTSYTFLNLGRHPGATKLESVFEQKHVKVMAVYIPWLLAKDDFHLPANWKSVDTWDLQNNHVLWSNSVTFFAEGCENARELSAHLAVFDPTLPKTIKVTRAKILCGEPSPGN